MNQVQKECVVIKKAIVSLAKDFGYEIIPVKDRIPQKAVVLVAPARTGSTWLLDAVRCHPHIEFWPAIIFHYLLINGSARRYPADLSNRSNCHMPLEQSLGVFHTVPLFSPPAEVAFSQDEAQEHFCAIEKIHPDFVEYSADVLEKNVDRIERLKKGIELKFVYNIRDPRSAIVSYLNYNKRNPGWGHELASNWELMAQRMTESFRCIEQSMEKRPGLLVDYSETSRDVAKVLERVFHFIWPDASENQKQLFAQIMDFASQVTRREQRVSTTPFLGETAGTVESSSKEYESFFTTYAKEIESCNRSYENLKAKSPDH